jgi:apolipoprotein N-acyltransferase
VLHGVTARQAAYIGFAFGYVWFASTLWWLANLFGGAAIALWEIAALYPMLFCALLVVLERRLPRVPLWLIAAILWTAIEYLRSEVVQPTFGFLGLGYAVVNAPYIAALASVFGSYGLTFLIVALGGALLTPAQRSQAGRLTPAPAADSASKTAVRSAFAYRWLALLILWEGAFLLKQPLPEARNPLRVRLVQASSEDEEAFFRFSRTELTPREDLILWPEYSFFSDPRQNTKLWAQLTQLARERQAYFLFGAKDQLDPQQSAAFRNTAFLLDPEGREVGRHVKNHTIHFMQDGRVGNEARAISTRLGRLGIALCFDFDYPDIARRLAADGAEVFLVPSNNPRKWGAIQRLQSRQMLQMRAIECGRWLASADVAGNTGAFAPNGLEYLHLPSSEAGAIAMPIGRETRTTFFVRFGWRFGQMCVLGMLAFTAAAFLPRRK